MSPSYVMAFDSGTTGIRAILFDHAGRIVSDAQPGVPQMLGTWEACGAGFVRGWAGFGVSGSEIV